jgi:hypothetical protein
MAPSSSSLAPVIALLLSASVSAVGLGPSDRGFVDGITVEERTGAVTLLLVVDMPLEDGLTKPRVRNKIFGYRTWLENAKFKERFPNARLDSDKILVIAHPAPRNALGQMVLQEFVAYASEQGFVPKTKELPARAGTK